jgi:hypothetical protein
MGVLLGNMDFHVSVGSGRSYPAETMTWPPCIIGDVYTMPELAPHKLFDAPGSAAERKGTPTALLWLQNPFCWPPFFSHMRLCAVALIDVAGLACLGIVSFC